MPVSPTAPEKGSAIWNGTSPLRCCLVQRGKPIGFKKEPPENMTDGVVSGSRPNGHEMPFLDSQNQRCHQRLDTASRRAYRPSHLTTRWTLQGL